jgi:uncharacterized protein (TIGR03435 family)
MLQRQSADHGLESHYPLVRIERTRHPGRGTKGWSKPGHWRRDGFDLLALIADVYETAESRIEWHAAGVDSRVFYDVEVRISPGPRDAMHEVLQEAIEQHFRLTITHEVRPTDVYVMTVAADSDVKPVRLSDAGGGLFSMSSPEMSDADFAADEEWPVSAHEMFRKISVPASISGELGMADLAAMLSQPLGRPVIDETGMDGTYDVTVNTGESSDDFFRALRDQTGLVLTPAQRDVEILVVRSVSPQSGERIDGGGA